MATVDFIVLDALAEGRRLRSTVMVVFSLKVLRPSSPTISQPPTASLPPFGIKHNRRHFISKGQSEV